jgi:hypothetical protein
VYWRLFCVVLDSCATCHLTRAYANAGQSASWCRQVRWGCWEIFKSELTGSFCRVLIFKGFIGFYMHFVLAFSLLLCDTEGSKRSCHFRIIRGLQGTMYFLQCTSKSFWWIVFHRPKTTSLGSCQRKLETWNCHVLWIWCRVTWRLSNFQMLLILDLRFGHSILLYRVKQFIFHYGRVEYLFRRFSSATRDKLCHKKLSV